MTLFPFKRQDLLGAEGQHGSVAAGNKLMLRAIYQRTQVQIPRNFAQRYQKRHSLPRRRSLGAGQNWFAGLDFGDAGRKATTTEDTKVHEGKRARRTLVIPRVFCGESSCCLRGRRNLPRPLHRLPPDLTDFRFFEAKMRGKTFCLLPVAGLACQHQLVHGPQAPGATE